MDLSAQSGNNKDGRRGNVVAVYKRQVAARAELLDLFRRYEKQLLDGCSDRRCIEATCYTGRVNTSQKPVRRYTLRSARAIALTLSSSPEPRDHLCPYLHDTARPGAPDNHGAPRDVSSLTQMLCDTSIVGNFAKSISRSSLDAQLVQQNEVVSRILNSARHFSTSTDSLSNEDLAGALAGCFQWLLDKAPEKTVNCWMMVDQDIISNGFTSPSKDQKAQRGNSYDSQLNILDILNHDPYLRLLERIMCAMCQRTGTVHDLCGTYREANTAAACPKHDLCVASLFATKIHAHNSTRSHAKVVAAIVWLKRLFIRNWNAQCIIDQSDHCYAILEVLQSFNSFRLKAQVDDSLIDLLKLPIIASRVGHLELARSVREEPPSRQTRLLHYNFLFSMEDKSFIFKLTNHLTMREAHSAIEQTFALRQRGWCRLEDDEIPEQLQHAEQHYLLLSVDRDSILKDCFDQLWQRRRGELRRPLRVRLGEADELDIGHDLGGVQIEFFNLVCKSVFAEEAQMFTTDSVTGVSRFRPGSLQPLHMFELVGLLIALALYNGITLPIKLTRAFYTNPALLGITNALSPGLETIRDGWPVVSQSLANVLAEDIPGLEYAFSMEANGIRFDVVKPRTGPLDKSSSRMTLQIVPGTAFSTDSGASVDITDFSEAWPGWRLQEATSDTIIPEVTVLNKESYIHDYVQWLCYQSVAPQWNAFLKGFLEADLFQPRILELCFSAEDIKAQLEGSDTLDIVDLIRWARYDGYEARSRYILSFWHIVFGWSEEKQKQLLKFVTAAERIPITGARNLTFIIKKAHPEDMESLPTSSTCFGTLMLPKYATPEILSTKLDVALKYGSEGFGTG